MFNARITRLGSLLLALGLLLSCAVTGCSEGNRDQGTDPLVTYKTIYYAFDWTAPDTAAKAATIPSSARFVDVRAVDANGDDVLADIGNYAIAQMPTDDEGNRLAVTKYKEEAVSIFYVFYHEVDGQTVVDCLTQLSLVDLEDGEIVYCDENQKLTISAKVFDANGEETTDFLAGDDIYVQVYANNENISASEDVELISDQADVVAVGEVANESIQCQAKAAGEANLSVNFAALHYPALATVTVHPVKDITYTFKLDDEAGIPSTAEFVYIKAIDAKGNELKSGLVEDEIAKMEETEGVYSAKSYFDAAADKVFFVFYRANGEMKVSECTMGVDVADLEEGAIVAAASSQQVVVSLKVMDKAGSITDTFKKGDTIYVQTFAGTENISGENCVELLSDNEKCVSVTLGYSSLSESAECEAVAAGTAKLAVEINGITCMDLATITVTE